MSESRSLRSSPYGREKKTAISGTDVSRLNHSNYFAVASFQPAISLNQLPTKLGNRLRARGKARKRGEWQGRAQGFPLYRGKAWWNHSLPAHCRQGGEKRAATAGRERKLNSALLSKDKKHLPKRYHNQQADLLGDLIFLHEGQDQFINGSLAASPLPGKGNSK